MGTMSTGGIPWRVWHAIGWMVVAVVTGLALAGVSPPRVVGRDAPAGEFSAERALVYVRALADKPRPVGSQAHADAREYVLSSLRTLGLSPEVQRAESTMTFAGKVVGATIQNVLARVPGKEEGGAALLLACHYDGVQNSPAASDDASGVAIVLETARALLAGPQLDHDVWLLISDAEEQGLLGAQAFVRDHPVAKRIGAVLNFEARGSRGPVAMYDTGPNNGQLIEALAATPRPIAASWIAYLSKLLPNDTDLTAFKPVGIPGMAFAYADGLEHYHHHTDSVATLSPASLQHGGSYALALARVLGNQDLRGAGTPDRVYFDLFGTILVHYPFWVARLLAAAGIGYLAWLLARTVRCGRARGRTVLQATLSVPAAVLLAVLPPVAITVVLALSMNSLGIVSQIKLYAWSALLFAAFVTYRWTRRTARRLGPEAAFLGYAIALAILATAAGALAPALTPPVFWPLLLTAIGATPWLLGRTPGSPLVVVVHDGGVALASILVAPVLYSLVLAAGLVGPILAAAIAPLYLGLALAPLEPPDDSRLPTRASRSLVVGSAVILLTAILLSRESARELESSSLLYAIDSDQDQAHFLTYDDEPNGWVAAFVSPGTLEPLPTILFTSDAVRHGPARIVPAPRAEIELLQDHSDPSARDLVVKIRSTAECFQLWQDSGPRILLRSAGGRPVLSLVRFSPEIDAELVPFVFADHSRRVFRYHHCGIESDGVVLELHADAPGPIELRIVDERSGLPTSAGTASFPRPTHVGPREQSDRTLVARGFRF